MKINNVRIFFDFLQSCYMLEILLLNFDIWGWMIMYALKKLLVRWNQRIPSRLRWWHDWTKIVFEIRLT